MILTKFLRDKKVPSDVKGRCATAHGFRSSFRNWASENGYSQEAAERALAHTIKNSAEWSYHRTDLLDQRHYDAGVGGFLGWSRRYKVECYFIAVGGAQKVKTLII